MLENRNRSVCVFISLATDPGTLLPAFAGFIEELESKGELESVPVHWCFPARFLEYRTGQEARLVPMLRGRLASGRDLFLPRGYAAAPHTFLLAKDIRQDLEWALHNPWQSGGNDVFEGIYPVVFPANPDWRRASSRDMYHSFAERLLLELIDEASDESCYLYMTPQKSVRITLYTPPEKQQTAGQFKRDMVKRLRRSPFPVALHLCADRSTRRDEISSQVHELTHLLDTGIVFKNLSEIDDASMPVEKHSWRTVPAHPVPSGLCRRFTTGYSRTAISASSRGRRMQNPGTGKDTSIMRERLLATAVASPLPGTPISEREEIPVTERSLIADMSGAVSLIYRDISAFFDEGMLTGINKHEKPVLCGKPASSYYVVEDLRYDFRNDGAFSFEAESSHGLRSSLTIDGAGVTRPGHIVRDFLFIEGEEHLVVSTVCAFPQFSDGVCVQAWAPLELPLFEYRGEAAFTVEARALDGEKYTSELTGNTGHYLFTGGAFKLQNDTHAVYITYPETGTNVFRQLPVRIEKRGVKKTAFVSPGGCYHSASGECYSHYAIHTVFAITVQTAGSKRYPSIMNALKDTGEPWCRYLRPGTANSPL